MKHPQKRRLGLVAIFLTATMLLSACGGTIETDLTLYTDDRFEATSLVTAPAAGLTLVGGAEALDQELEKQVQQARAEGADMSWRREKSKSPDEIAYRIDARGTGYDGLADAYGINVEQTQYQGQEALIVSASPNYDLSGVQNTVRLHVGKILQTDNQRSGNNTIVWSGTETLEAIVTPASSTNWLPILLVVLVVAVLAAAAFVFLRRRPVGQVATAASAAPVVQRGNYCPHCGQPAQSGARFCMSCGQPIPPREG